MWSWSEWEPNTFRGSNRPPWFPSRLFSAMNSLRSAEHRWSFCSPKASSRSNPSMPNWLGAMTHTSSGTRLASQWWPPTVSSHQTSFSSLMAMPLDS